MEGRIQEFVKILAGMRWSDYLDIILVAYLIYMLLPLIRSKNTMRVVRVVVVLVIGAGLTDVLNLHTLSYILNQFLAIGILALVILFQP